MPRTIIPHPWTCHVMSPWCGACFSHRLPNFSYRGNTPRLPGCSLLPGTACALVLYSSHLCLHMCLALMVSCPPNPLSISQAIAAIRLMPRLGAEQHSVAWQGAVAVPLRRVERTRQFTLNVQPGRGHGLAGG